MLGTVERETSTRQARGRKEARETSRLTERHVNVNINDHENHKDGRSERYRRIEKHTSFKTGKHTSTWRFASSCVKTEPLQLKGQNV